MGKTVTIRRGYDIQLKGEAEKKISDVPVSDVIAVKPADFPNIKPKLTVGPGDTILAGDCLFTDKLRPELRFTSPVSGEIADIILGDKRRINEIRILPDKESFRYREFPKSDPASLAIETIKERLLESGCWNYIRQRPYSIIAHPEDKPKSIFVSCFDSSPLAPDLEFVIHQEGDNFKAGLQVLQTLSGGHLHLGLKWKDSNAASDYLGTGVPESHIHYFRGPHPAGNVGIQIHHVDPIQKGEIVWYVHPQDVIIIGRLFAEGRYRADRVVALTGSHMSNPQYVRVQTGQLIRSTVPEETISEDIRLIQGNVLHGKTSASDDFISFYTNQITAIPEGREPEFMGWLMPGLKKLSLSRTYFSWLTPNKKYSLNTNLHGEPRAFVMTGQYDKVLPMDIYPVFLLKAILAKDIEKMEALGIYEVAEEDFALCEFVCTSKIEVQHIIAQGLDLVREEG